jgi:hypothetical protein
VPEVIFSDHRPVSEFFEVQTKQQQLKNSNFYVNPFPKYLKDIIMTKEKVDSFFNC